MLSKEAVGHFSKEHLNIEFQRVLIMRKYMCILYRIISFLSIVILQFANANANELEAPVSLDVHVHYYQPNAYEDSESRSVQKMFFDSNISKFAFILSPAFGIFEKNSVSQYIPWLSDDSPDFIDSLNKQVSDYIIEKDQKRLFGLCGVNLRWDKLDLLAKNCLKYPHMIGIKLRHDNENDEAQEIFPLSNPLYIKKLNSLFSEISSTKPVVLWHPHYREKSSDAGASELYKVSLRNLITIVKKYKEINFIIAHGLANDYDAQNYFLDLLNGEKLSNLYLDISMTQSTSTGSDGVRGEPSFSPEVNFWRKFGLDHVLFGSDAPFATPVRIFNALKNTKELTKAEFNMITNINGLDLLKKQRIEQKWKEYKNK